MDKSVSYSNQDDEGSPNSGIDFFNTKVAFSGKDNSALKWTALLFKTMNNPTLSKIANSLGYWSVKLRIPFADFFIKKTIFQQFVGGDSLLDCQKAIDKLHHYDTLTVLDYGAEGKKDSKAFDEVMHENLRAVEMAASNNSVPIITIKVTGLAKNSVLEKKQAGIALDDEEKDSYAKTMFRLEKICERAEELGVGVFIDGEETWVQQTIDEIALELMEYYNKEKATVFNTYQMYVAHKLEELYSDHKRALENEFILGAKLVRGAYMEKERKRAEEMGYPSPIQPDKQSTDEGYNQALMYCIDNYETICFCNATHNINSTELMAYELMKRELDKSHPHLNFCQLYGMSDNITFNLADAGYNVAKYMPYGPVKEVIPYLVRRAQENSSVAGEVSRELSLIVKELERRKLN